MSQTENRPRRVIRLHQLPQYVGVQRSQIEEAVKAGLLHPYSPFGGRALVVDEEEVATLQEAARKAAKAKRKQVKL